MWIHDEVSKQMNDIKCTGATPRTIILGSRVYFELVRYNQVVTGKRTRKDIGGIGGYPVCVAPNNDNIVSVTCDSNERVMRMIKYM